MYTFDIKKSEKQSLAKGEKKLMPENSKKKRVSASRFLKPNYPNMFQCRKKDAGINENTILQYEADVMGNRVVRKNYLSTYPVPVNSFNSSQPLQRKLVFRGMEQKVGFVGTYHSKSIELDEFTAPNGEIKKISEESQALDGKETELIQNMVRCPDYYYIGDKNNIVSILTEMYYKLKQPSGIPQNNEQGRINLIKLAIDRMYNQANAVKISDVNIT